MTVVKTLTQYYYVTKWKPSIYLNGKSMVHYYYYYGQLSQDYNTITTYSLLHSQLLHNALISLALLRQGYCD
jgi:hypothetical protein